VPLRVAAISFLNPAPLLYDFEHEPRAARLRKRYTLHYTQPSACAAELSAGTADLGLIPIAALTPELAIVPGCTIASLGQVRSILLLVKNPRRLSVSDALTQVRTVAADIASLSSVAYTRILFEHFHDTRPLPTPLYSSATLHSLLANIALRSKRPLTYLFSGSTSPSSGVTAPVCPGSPPCGQCALNPSPTSQLNNSPPTSTPAATPV